jgi:glucosylceramidase
MLATHEKYPGRNFFRPKPNANNGANSWGEGMTTFRKMIEDMNHFATGYMFWNLVLDEKSTSTWGWKQNSLLKIDTSVKSNHLQPGILFHEALWTFPATGCCPH